MNYTIILKCSNEEDASKYDRKLEMNNYESASAAFKALVKVTLDNLIDPFIIEFYYGEKVSYRLESLKV